jgi:hypothetical protein
MTPILADVALPLFGFMWLPLIVLFIPICGIEIYVLSRYRKGDVGNLIWPVIKANFYSATVGFVATWIGLVILSCLIWLILTTFRVSDTGPFFYYLQNLVFLGGSEESYPVLDWLAVATFLIVAYFASVWFEKRSLKKSFPEFSNAEVLKISRKMNAWSYLFLGCLWVGYLILGIF